MLVESIRGQLRASGLSTAEIARRAIIPSRKTLDHLMEKEPNLTLKTLRRLLAVVPENLPMAATETIGEYSRSRKIILQPEHVMHLDSCLVYDAAAAKHFGEPVDGEGTVFHVIDPHGTDIGRSVFRRWGVVSGVEDGTDFTGTTIDDVPDPIIRGEFRSDVDAVVKTLQPQWSIINRRRTAVCSGQVTERLFSRVIMPRIGAGGSLEVIVLRRLQEFGATVGLFPQLALSTPSNRGAH
tara:strand:- start:302 stop:1018 length:717 start_codon:yes stop_codon:yes gene_type:complete